MGYIPPNGDDGSILSFNDADLVTVNSLEVVLNVEVSKYADEIYTRDYIRELFTSLQKVCENCQSIINTTRKYLEKNEEISDIPMPDIKDFNFDFSGLDAISSAVSVSTNEPLYQTGTVKIKNGSLNIRSSASTDSQIIGSLKKDVPLKIIGKSADGDWYEIELENGETGFVSAKYVGLKNLETNSVSGNEKSSNDMLIGNVNITSGTLNVRDGASINSRIISSLQKGDTVKIIDDSDSNWLKIQLSNGKEAYVSSKYITRGE